MRVFITYRRAPGLRRIRLAGGIGAGLAKVRAVEAPAPAPIITRCGARSCRCWRRTAWWRARRRGRRGSASTSCERGGNAVDAAVAVGFALAVTLPRAGNLGGGGFMLVHLAGAQRDDRDRLPRDRAGRGDARHVPRRRRARPIRRSRAIAALAVGVPGTVAGLALAHEKYGSGKFTLAELIAPAITLAREGFAVDDDLADSLPRARPRLGALAAPRRIFCKPTARRSSAATRLVQADLAATLDAIARERPARRSTRARSPRRSSPRVQRRRRHHDARRPRGLPGDRAPAGARHLSRLRHRLDAAAVLGRRASHPDPQHPRRVSICAQPAPAAPRRCT